MEAHTLEKPSAVWGRPRRVEGSVTLRSPNWCQAGEAYIGEKQVFFTRHAVTVPWVPTLSNLIMIGSTYNKFNVQKMQWA